jgi:hypothetical protein
LIHAFTSDAAAIFHVPLITAFLARRLGRSFWKWFAIGCVLPFVSVFILLLLPEIKSGETTV